MFCELKNENEKKTFSVNFDSIEVFGKSQNDEKVDMCPGFWRSKCDKFFLS